MDEARHIPILSWSGLYIVPRRERQAQCSSEGWYEASGVQPASGQGELNNEDRSASKMRRRPLWQDGAR